MIAFTYNKLRGRIVEKFGSVRKFTLELPMSYTTIMGKLNGAVGFSQQDILEWCELLEIDHAEIGDYFFN